MKKKIVYITLFVILIVAIILFFAFQEKIVNFINKNKKNPAELDNGRNGTTTETKEKVVTVTEVLSDGTMYYIENENKNTDIVIGDNYFDTQVADIMTNPTNYEGKVIEIEGMFLENEPYTFVGRYSLSNLCPYCAGGYSYLEYVWNGDYIELADEFSWIKVIGKIEKGNDETSNYQDYYFIKASAVELMNQRGQDTVKN